MDERLSKFRAVVDHGGYNNAAKAIHVSQPAVSMAVKQLERELGVALFERRGRQNQLTRAGSMVYKTILDMTTSMDDLSWQLAQLKEKKPLLRVGMIDSLADLLFVYNDTFQVIARHADISLVVDSSRSLISGISTARLDSALTAEPPTNISSRLHVEPIGNEPLVAVCSPGFHSSATEPLSYISYNQQAMTYARVEAKLDEHGIARRAVLQSTSPEVMLQLCLQGVGFSVLPYLLVRQHIQNGKLETLSRMSNSVLHRPIVALHHKNRARTDGQKTLFKYAQTLIAAADAHAQKSVAS